MKTYAYIIWTNLMISTFTFGGGYIVIPMIRKYYVEKRSYISEQELMEIAAVAQSVPGAIAVNLSVTTAYHIKGKSGAFLAAIFSILPALLILSLISSSYDAFRANAYIAAALKGMEAGVAAIMIDVVYDMIAAIYQDQRKRITLLIPLSFVAVFFLHIHVALILLGCVALSIGYYEWRQRTCL